MHNYNPDLTSAIMVTAAHQLLKNFIENRENLDELTKDTCVNRMEELLENDITRDKKYRRYLIISMLKYSKSFVNQI